MAVRKKSKKKRATRKARGGGGITGTATAPDLVESIRLRQALEDDFRKLQDYVEDVIETHSADPLVRRLRVPLSRVETRVIDIAYGFRVQKGSSRKK